MTLFPHRGDAAARLREFLLSASESKSIVQAPGCFDGLSARLLEQAGFEAGFLGGFSVAAARLGLPDVGLLSYGEMVDQARSVCAATSLPIIGDGDTGYGNPINAERTLLGYAQAGLACVMIEDQVWPKRCGHTAGKEVVDRSEAVQRIRACVRTRTEHGLDILVMARTDAVATHGLDEALWRAEAFAEAGADVTFVEALETPEQMERYCAEVAGHKTVNLVEDGKTPWLSPTSLAEIGYSLVIYPVSLLLAGITAMGGAADKLASGGGAGGPRATFDDARNLVGWADYEERMRTLSAEDLSDHSD
ncbi:isocitrate lyase/PEP mutase family protein [Candidatus Poriferisodalis sp.]|uniref:isocitrate lyase/PEP mutase family protein n=1 Tax=Candidatus Poriferisodalis sp. TaxID=3101277 RepID=UPI003B020D9A